MTKPAKLLLTILSVSALLLSTQSWATNGYFSHGTSIAEKGLAGAGVAYSQDTLSAANNPAGMVWQGERYDIGVAFFAPMRTYTSTGTPTAPAGTACNPCPFSIGDGNQSIDSDNELFLIPQFGYNWEINSDRTIGISVFGNGGMNTEWEGGIAILGPNPSTGTNFSAPGTYGSGTAGVNLSQLFFATTYAAKISQTSSWGISGIVVYQEFKADGISNFGGFSLDPSKLSNNGDDSASGIGLRIGFQSELSPGVKFGAAYQPEIDMSEFDNYAGLFAEQGDFDIPSNLTVGLAWELSNDRTIVVDVQRINYEDVAAVSNPISTLTDGISCISGLTGGTGSGCLGGANGAGFGWEDITVLKIGYQWVAANDWTWRVGYSNTDQPIPESEVTFNILAPGVIDEHLTFGFSKAIDANSSFNFSAMYALSNSVSGANSFDLAQTIELEMDQYEVAASYSKRF